MATFEQLQALQVTETDAYLRGLQSVVNPVGDKISTEIPMKTETMVSPIGRSIGPWREWTGDRQIVTSTPTSHIMVAKPFEKTVGVQRVKVETDQTGVEALKFEELGKLSGRWRDQLVIEKLLRGETDLAYDGVSFFNATHPADGDAAAYSNLSGSGTAPWYVFDLSSSLKPMVMGVLNRPELTHLFNPSDPNVFFQDMYLSGLRAYGCADFGMPHAAMKMKSSLDASNFDSALVSIRQRVDNKGQSLGLGLDDSNILVVVPPILSQTAARLFGQKNLGEDGDNILYGVPWTVCSRLPNS